MKGLGRILPAVIGLAASPFLRAQVQEFRLPSGLRCVLLEKHDQPLIRLELTVAWDPALETKAGEGGLLAAALRNSGAGSNTRGEFNRTLDDLGIVFGFEGRRDGFRWTLATDSRSQEPALELLADAVFRPVLEEAQVETQRLALAKAAADRAPMDRGVAQFLWGLGDAGTALPAAGGVLDGLSAEELQNFRRRALRPERATLVLHGDLSLAQAKELVHLHFGLWGPREAPGGGGPGTIPGEPRLRVVQGSTAEAELWVGSRLRDCRPAVREILALLLAQVPEVMAPGILRTCTLGPGEPFLLKLKAAANGREGLVAAAPASLDRLRRGFSAQDVERARLRWKAELTALPLHPREQIRRFQEGALDPAFRAQVEAVGVRDVNEALTALLAPAELRFLLLGADAALARKAEAAGLSRVN